MTQNSNWDQNPFSEYGADSETSYNVQQSVQSPQPPSDIPQPAYFYEQQHPYGGFLPYPHGMSEPPLSRPLPLREAVRQLFGQYLKIITKPSVKTFIEEMGKASWDIVWVQLLAYALISTLLGFLALHFVNTSLTSGSIPGARPLPPQFLQFYQILILGSSFGQIVLVPVFFFIGVGIQYTLARAFGGQGTFLMQSYTTTLYQVPLNIALQLITIPLTFIPTAGSLITTLPNLGVLVYSIVLNIFSIMAVHRLSGGKATATVLLPLVVFLVLICAFVVFVALFLITSVRTIHP